MVRKSKKAPVDNSLDQPIVKVYQSNNETPLGGVGRTDQGLTTHADGSSMEAAENPISALSSRQSSSSAVDDFCLLAWEGRSMEDVQRQSDKLLGSDVEVLEINTPLSVDKPVLTTSANGNAEEREQPDTAPTIADGQGVKGVDLRLAYLTLIREHLRIKGLD